MRTTELVYYLFSFILCWTLLILFKKFLIVNQIHNSSNNLNLIKSLKKTVVKTKKYDSREHMQSHLYNNEKIIQPTMGTRKIHDIEYGAPISENHNNRNPVVMIRMKMDPSLYDKFVNQPLFQCQYPKDMVNYGMKFSVDYPKSKDTHFYYEGYFHALGNTSSPFWSRNPRSGQEFYKPPTTQFLRGFYESFGHVNHHIFLELKSKLYQSALSRQPNHPINDLCGLISSWIDENLHFADLSVQVHYGSQIYKEQLFWHIDAENSLLHFGITVHGRRILHSKRAKVINGAVTEILEEQLPGDTYISSSALMNHAPEYPVSTWNASRIIAIQSRFLYTTSQLKLMRQIKTADSWIALTNIIADVLSRSELKLPSVAYIDNVLTSMY